MESTLVSSRSIWQTNRWDFEYFDPEYIKTIDKIKKSGWSVRALGEIILALTDGQHGYLVHLPEGIPLIRTTNVFENEIRLDNVRYIAPEVHAKLKRSHLKSGDILLTTIGSIGVEAVVDDSIKEANINQNLVKITPNSEIIPFYLSLFLNSSLGKIQTQRTASKSVVPIVNYPRLREMLVPLPPLHIQDSIAQVIQDAYNLQREKLERAEILLNEIDQYVFEKLELAPESVIESKLFIKHISQIKEKRFDVEFNMGFHKFDPYPESVLSIKEVAVFPKKTKNPSTEPQKPFNYIDISSIDIHLCEITKAEEIIGIDAPSRARQIVHTGDIIVSTVRPTRRAIAIIPNTMDGFICSTGFTIVRATHRVIPEYLHIALCLATTLEQFGRRSAGSSYPAILENDIKESLIPFPDKGVQKEIVTEVTKRRNEAKILLAQAETTIAEAKARVERMILGEEEVA